MKSSQKVKLGFLIILYCTQWGCVTMSLRGALVERGYSYNEMSPHATIKYCDQETIKDKLYYRYLIYSKPFSRSLLYTTASCDSDRIIEILLPIDTEKGLKAFLRETNLQKACIDQPAEIHYGNVNELKKQKPVSTSYPNNIFFDTPKPWLSDEVKVYYQVISEDHNIRFVDVIIDSSDLKFVCRSKGKYIASFALFPFTLVLDVGVLPISLPLFLIWASGPGV
jgi:hypothetical protein